MLRLISVVFLLAFSFGCSATSSSLRSNSPKQENTFSMDGTYKMGLILEDILKKEIPVKLSVSVVAELDPQYNPTKAEETKERNFIALRLNSELRSYLGIYDKFSIVDTDALDDLSNASHLLTMKAIYGLRGEWSGKLIDLKSKKTLGEYYCTVLENENFLRCN